MAPKKARPLEWNGRKLGAALKVGDVVEAPMRVGQKDRIKSLRPYTGPLAHLFPEGAQIAEFEIAKVGMTIDNSDYY